MPKKKTTEEKAKLGKKDIEDLIVKLAKEGMISAKIGQVLKDTYKVPSSKALGIKIKKVLSSHGIKEKIPDDLKRLLEKADSLKKHFSKNKQDKTAKRGLQITEAKVRKLGAYYKRKRILPPDWKY